MTTPVALVTAASKGIGAACARELHARGYQLALLARHDDVRDLAAELGGFAVVGSITDEAALRALVDGAYQRWGRIDVVIGNTGHPAKGQPLTITDEQWHEGYELIVGSAIRLARLVSPLMKSGGAFVHVSSYAAVRPDVARPVSTVMRAALGAWVELHAKSCAAAGIRVNAVLPGFVDSYPVSDDILATIPVGRIGRLEELAKTVAFLASSDASYVTGQCLLVDGGMI